MTERANCKSDCNTTENTAKITAPITPPINNIESRNLFSKNPVFPLGGTFIKLGDGLSKPRAKAGKPSVTKFIHKICAGKRGLGSPKNSPPIEISPL